MKKPKARSVKVSLFALLSFLWLLPATGSAQTYGKLPLMFEPNQVQADGQVKFLSRGNGYTLFLTSTEAVLALRRPELERGKFGTSILRMQLAGVNPNAEVKGIEELPGKANYFIGKDPSKWRTNVPTYAKVHYRDVYPGIDLLYYGNQRQLEYDFVVAPGADPERIVFGFEGADRLEIDAQGDLVLHAAGGTIRQRKPFIYQEIDGIRREIDGGYVLNRANQVRFKVPAYDRSRPLVIDPTLSYSTYLGGSGLEFARAVAVDSAGHAYVTGNTASINFPTTPGAFQAAFGGGGSQFGDAFVAKLNPTGSGLVYSTYLGGSGEDFASGVAVDAAGNAYVTGASNSSNFPTTPGAFQTIHAGGVGTACCGAGYDAFVTKLDPTGGALVYSTYLGGNAVDGAFAIAIDGGGNAYVTGHTVGTFPNTYPTTPGAFQVTTPNSFGCSGWEDAFVTKLNSTGTALLYSTFLAGNNNDGGQGIAVDALGSAYVTGFTLSTNFPVTLGAFQTTTTNTGGACGGGQDAFVTKLDPLGTALIYSTYLGGSNVEQGAGVAIDGTGNAWVTGITNSLDFPTTLGAFQSAFAGGGFDAFVTKLNPIGTGLVYSTYLGGSGDDQGSGVALDPTGNAYVTGSTDSANFPISNAVQSAFGGVRDAFVTKINPTGTGLFYSTYLGGPGYDVGVAVALDSLPSPNVYVAGVASAGFPTTPAAFQTTFGGGIFDAFVAKIGPVTACTALIGAATFSSIQGAVNAAGAFSTINVTGTCHENVFILDEKVRITLDGGGTAVISGLVNTSDAIFIRGKGITIKNFASITGGRNGILVLGRGTVIILNNVIENNDRDGISIAENSSARIGFESGNDTAAQGNTIQNNGGRGVSIGRSSNARIVGNDILNNADDGIAVFRVSHADASDNLISGNGGDGIFVGQNSGVNLGNDTGSTIFDLPNDTTVNNGGFGVRAATNSYVDGRIGTLNGTSGQASIPGGNINSLISADLALTKTDSPDPVTVGANLTYTLTVTNNGPSTATGVVLTDDVPAPFQSHTTTQGSCTTPAVGNTGTATCNLGSLASGAIATVTIVMKPTTAGGFNNTATVIANEPDFNLANNTAMAVTTVNAAPVITTTSLPTATVGVAYSQTLAVSGGTTPLTWSLFSGALPVSTTLSSAGVISGTPTTAGTSNFTVRVTDANGVFDDQPLAITVVAPPVVTAIPAPGFQPSGLAYDGANLYVSELSGFRKIFKLNPTTGAVIGSILAPSPTGLDGTGNPNDIVYDGAGHLFVSDIGDFKAGIVYEIDTAGTTIFRSFSLPFRGGAIAFDGTNLYIGDVDSSQVRVTDRLGNLIRTFDSGLRPAGMVFDPATGHLWVISILDSKISEITTNGVLIRSCDGPRNPGVQGLGGITIVGPNFYVAEVSDPDPFNPPDVPGTIFNVDRSMLPCNPPLPAAQCIAPPSGLVSWWSGDGHSLDIQDGNNATLVNGATFAPGKVGQAFSFDGVNDFVEIPDAANLKPANVTVDAWVRFDSLDTPGAAALGLQYIVFKKNTRATNHEGYVLNKLRSAGADRFQFVIASAGGLQVGVDSTTAIVPGQFYHVAGTYDGASVKLYVNGVLEAQQAGTILLDYGTRPVFISTSGESFDGKLAGLVDEVEIYNRALTAAEIQAIVNAGSAGKCKLPDLVVTSLAVTSFTSNSISYSYTITNIGNAPANLDGPTASNADNVSVQAFISADTIFNNAGDIPAGGTILGVSPLGQLAPGQSFSGSFSATVGPINLSATPYLILKVDWGEVVDESDETNNTKAVLITSGPEVSFGAAVNFNVAPGARPTSVAVGDFNEDGRLDLAVANLQPSNNVSVLLANGDGSFGSPTNFPAGLDPRAVAVGDFNRDGSLDLAVANGGGGNVSILLGTGTGSFGVPTNFSVGTNPRSVAVGDFNGDGKPDLAVANLEVQNVSVLLGNGDGTFGAATHFATGGAGSDSVAAGDFNRDGNLDLVATNQTSANVSVLLGTGTGSFGAATNFAAGQQPIFVASGDFNRDGKEDLAVANFGGSNVSILMGNGDGSFEAALNLPLGGSPLSVAIGDLNGDGNQDLALANHSINSVSVLLGNGTGSFGVVKNFAVGTTPASVAIGDFNRDGRPDLAAANADSNNVSILLNATTFDPAGGFSAPTNFAAGDFAKFVAVGDFNRDGKPDLAVANIGAGTVSILLGNGTGSFGPATNFAAGPGPSSVAIGDLNRDGKLDLAVGNAGGPGTVAILLGAGSGSFSAAPSVGVASGVLSVALADLNGDGKLDLVTANGPTDNVSVLLGNGDGTFGAAMNFAVGDDPQSVAIGDLNGDGKLDLVVANRLTNNVSVLLGTGTGSFGVATNLPVGTSPRSVAIGDLNRDGKLDLVVANSGAGFGGTVSVLLGNADGTFGAATNFAAGSFPLFVAIGDLNGDGKPDVAVADEGNDSVAILLGTGTGSLGTATHFTVGLDPESVAIADLNGDGKPDLVTANVSSDNVSVLLNTAPTAVNNPPVANNDAYTINEDTTLIIAAPGVLGNDTDADGPKPLTAILVSGPTASQGTLTLNANGSFTFTPAANFNGTVTFTYKANDGQTDSNIATVTITVTAVNDPPTISDIPDQTTNEDTPTSAIPFTVGDVETPAASLVVSGSSSNLTLVPNANIVFGGSGANRTVTITPAPNQFGTTTITITVSDGLLSASDSFLLTVNSVNDAPVAANDSYTTAEDTPLSVVAPGVLSNDADIDSATLNAVLVSGPTSGTLTLNSNGSFTFTPAANFFGIDSFTYKANDGFADSNVATVTINVTAVNDAPVATDDSYSVTEDFTLTVPALGVLGNDVDVDGNMLTAMLVSGLSPGTGTLTLNSNGSFIYTPATDFVGSVSFTYKANDGVSDSNIATVAITVNPAPDSDGDGFKDDVDNCPFTANQDQKDTDGDGVGDACDPDIDNDGVPNAVDNCPLVSNPDQADFDGDGIGDACDPDADGDGFGNAATTPDANKVYDGSTGIELRAFTAGETLAAGEIRGGDCDDANSTVFPGQGCVAAVALAFAPKNTATLTDSDADGLTDTQETSLGTNPNSSDTDGDGILDAPDNCKLTSNPDQKDTDGDGIGDACDTDADNDGVPDKTANAPGTFSQTFTPILVSAGGDNCPLVSNPAQADLDGDGVGDACDPDADADGFPKIATATIPADCNDLDATVNPGATEIQNNGKDDDCNAATPDTPFDIRFTLTGLPGETLDNWLPTDGAATTIVATVVDSTGIGISPQTITFSLVRVTAHPGKYTNDTSTDASEDFTHPFGNPALPITTIGNSLDLISRDFGGSITIRAMATLADGTVVQNDVTLPKDTNNNLIADAWENLYGGNLVANDDKDTSVANTNIGDGLTVFEEYRGFIWGLQLVQVPHGRAIDGFLYQTRAFTPTGPTGHFRLNPTRKDLFIKFTGYDATNPFALGGAFNEAGIDVHVRDAASTDPGGEQNIDVVLITNAATAFGFEDGRINKRGLRDWTWDTKGAASLGTSTAYGSATTFRPALDGYTGDKPYTDGGTLVAGTTNNFTGAPDGKLNPGGNVEDGNDNGVGPEVIKGKSEDKNSNGVLDGDKYVFGNFSQQLTTFDIDNNGLVELPVASDLSTINRDFEYSKAQVLKHTVTHEIVHALGCCPTADGHEEDSTSLMYKFSNNWSRDGHLSDYAKGQILIHNQ